MGTDKAFLTHPHSQQPCWLHQRALLQSLQPCQVWVSANAQQDFQSADIVRDVHDQVGPLGGLLASLECLEAPLLLVLAVDMIAMTAVPLQELLDQCQDGVGTVYHDAGFYQPTAAVYPRAALETVRAFQLAGHRRLQDLVQELVDAELMQVLTLPVEQRRHSRTSTPSRILRMLDTDPRLEQRQIHRCRRDATLQEDDPVTVEEPMEIRVDGHSVAVVMRTPGDDLDLTRGFLLTEGIVKDRHDIFEISQCPSQADGESRGNVVDVILTRPDAVDLEQLSRHVFTSSSCGLCGRATIESVFQQFAPVDSDLVVTQDLIMRLPDMLRTAQKTFAQTGGLHASALFDREGALQILREDVGRHNALDKVIGAAWERDLLPLRHHLLLVSGRISFELTQKALCAGIPLIAGISAPSTLAIDCAEAANQCLIGFLRERGMNIYAHPERVSG